MTALIPFPDLSPTLISFEILGIEIALRWYALAYIAGLVIGWRIVVALVRRPRFWPAGQSPMTPEQVEDLFTWVILGVIIGGRLGYVLFYQPAYFLAYPGDILKLWQGGMAFHGGFVGVVVAGVLYCRRHGLPMLQVGDAFSMAVTPGLLLGRLANFINAELWGRPTGLPWGVAFPGEAAQACGQVVGLCARHPSQLYEAVLEGVILGAVLVWLALRRGALRFPGRIMGTFIAGYGVARFLVEFARQPDAQFVSPGNPLGLAFEIAGYGLTMGQILSVPMILVGLWFIQRSARMAA